MSREDKVRMLYEHHMEEVFAKVYKARNTVEDILIELDDIEIGDNDWRKLDELATRALIELDNIE